MFEHQLSSNRAHLFQTDNHFASMASQIIVSLIYRLGLHMPSQEQPLKTGESLETKESASRRPARKDRTIEDRRILLGAFVITSMSVLLLSTLLSTELTAA